MRHGSCTRVRATEDRNVEFRRNLEGNRDRAGTFGTLVPLHGEARGGSASCVQGRRDRALEPARSRGLAGPSARALDARPVAGRDRTSPDRLTRVAPERALARATDHEACKASGEIADHAERAAATPP